MLNPDQRSEIEFYIKNGAVLCGLIGAIFFGVQHWKKFDTEYSLKAKLIGDTELVLDRFPPAILTGKDGGKYCEISGLYKVTNAGAYPFVVEDVTIQLFEVPFIQDMTAANAAPISYTISQRMEQGAKYPIALRSSVKVPVNEQFGLKNELGRAFGFIVKMDSTPDATSYRADSRYIVVANARAGLPDKDGHAKSCQQDDFTNPGVCFRENDLRHISQTFSCS